MNKVMSNSVERGVLLQAAPPVFEATQAGCSCALTDPIAAAYAAQIAAPNDTALAAAKVAEVDAVADHSAAAQLWQSADAGAAEDGAPLVYDHSGYIIAGSFTSVLTQSDATAFISLSAPTQGEGWGGPGYLTTASFDGYGTKTIWISTALGDELAAMQAAQQVAEALGKIPLAFLDYVNTINIFGDVGNGNAASAAYWNDDLNIYNLLGSSALEETLIHEFGHLVVDEILANDPVRLAQWQAAQTADGLFISQYAEDFSTREDAAESLLTYIMVRLYPERVGLDRVTDLEMALQHRFAFFDDLGFDYSTAGRDVSFQANNNYYTFAPSEGGGTWDAPYNLLDNDYGNADQGLRIVAVNGIAFDGASYTTFAEGGSVWVSSDGLIDFNAQGRFDGLLGGDTQDLTITYTVENAAGLRDTANATFTVLNPAKAVAAGGTETFETGASDWTDNTTTIDSGNGYLGGFDGTDFVEKTFVLGPDATLATVTFDFLEIDSWDNEDFLIFVNGQEINLGTFSWSIDEGATSVTEGAVTVTKEAEVDLSGYGNQSTSAWFASDALHRVTLDVATPGETLTLGFSSTLSSDVSDESWGIDNLTVTLPGSPPPPPVVPVISIASDTASVAEGAAGTVTQLAFTVSLSEPASTEITADVTVAGDATGATTLVIPAGETTVPLLLQIDGDDMFEPDETITVTLSNLSGAEAGVLSASQTVLNDDAERKPPTVLETFEDGATGWSDTTTTTDNGNGYLGQFGSALVEKSFALGAGVDRASVNFDFLEIDTWDNEDFVVYVNGQEINLGTFSWRNDEGASTFAGEGITVNKAAALDISGYGSSKGGRSKNDNLHTFSIDVAAPGETLTLGFTSKLDQGLRNESWGIDNLSIDTFDFA